MAMTTATIHEITRVTPSPDSLNSANEFTLPLTFFDTYWFKFPPVQSLYLYQLNDSHSTPSYFNSEILPRLKQSLSLALSHYLPVAGYLKWPPGAAKPVVSYTPNDGVTLTVAESNVANFDTLISYEMHRAKDLHPFTPQLVLSDDKAEILALQITLFPRQGFSIGTAAHHSAFDGRIASMFMRSWAYLCKHGTNKLPPELTPSFDRSVIKDPSGLVLLFLNQWRAVFDDNTISFKIPASLQAVSDAVVRATFEFSSRDIKGLKEKALSELEPDGSGKQQRHLSSFVVTLAYTATCLVKAKGDGDRDVVIDFGVDCRGRLDPPAPPTYFGNCVVNYSSSADVRNFVGEDGFAFAIDMVSGLVEKVKKGVLEGAVMNVSNFYAPKLPGTQLIMVAGSPKLNVYDADFGESKIKKVEIVSIERDEAVFMAESRDGNGGVEVGLALEKHEMDKFAALFYGGLRSLD
ncbi:phenolic glucoside malonyltransferase 2 [Hibiscus trionum]|uniref:Phenolic glucoside malonyltransferase 2 n=1 Tax=Hibiscus trionum TaxID=183268 RepID=A0A9W7I585_HIBTR|nr:phenolic glucoside malonyltransferase 2 [Hibiscus trionum]